MSNQGDGPGPANDGSGQQGETGGQWTGGQQPWSGSQPWASGGQDAQPPSWSTGETGPNVGPTMNNPQSSYYDRFSEASGEGLKVPQSGGGGGRGKVLIGLAAALVLIVAAVTVFALTRGDKSPRNAVGSSSTGAALAPVKATTWVNPTLGVGARALKDGWQTQSSDSEALRGQYDVPKSKDWKVDSNSTALGYADRSGKAAAMAGAVTEYHYGFCSADKNGQSAWVGIRGIGSADPTEAGPEWAKKFADAIAAGKHKSAKPGKVSPPKKINVDQGTIPALQYTVITESGDQDSCNRGKKYEIRTINFSTPGKSYQMVTVRMLGVTKELPAKQLDEVISTFRPSS